MNELDFSLGEESSFDSASGALRDYRVWRRNHPENEFAQYVQKNSNLNGDVLIELATADLIQQISTGINRTAEEYIAAISGVSASDGSTLRDESTLDLVDAEICARSELGDMIDRSEYANRFPNLRDELSSLFTVHEIDLEASRERKFPDSAPISIKGYALSESVTEGNSSARFEIWNATRLDDDQALQVVFWETENANDSKDDFVSLMKKRCRVDHRSLAKPLSAGKAISKDDESFFYVVIEDECDFLFSEFLGSTDAHLDEKEIAQWILEAHRATNHLSDSLGVAVPIVSESFAIRKGCDLLLLDFPFLNSTDHRKQLLELGLFLFSACLLEPDTEEIQQHLESGYAPIALTEVNNSVSEQLNAIYIACLHPEEKKRYRSVDNAIEDVERFVNGKPVKAAKRRWFGF